MSKEMPQDANPELVRFIEGIIIEKKMQDLPPLYLSEFMAELYTRLQDMLMVNYADSLNKEDYYAFSVLVESGKNEELQEFIFSHGNITEVMSKTLEQFKSVVLNNR